jgi:hypothetical protein
MSNPADDVEKDIEKAQRQQQQLLEEQAAKDQAELQEKRDSVFKQRLNIINASRGEIWTPTGNYMPNKEKEPEKKPFVNPLIPNMGAPFINNLFNK